MNILKLLEEREERTLSRYACRSADSTGRVFHEEKRPDDYRTVFAHDRDRILHSHAFRREKDKTQVFILPANDHMMTRLTHTLEVSQIGKTMACALGLNETLTEAIALGHDTPHTCFGHAGEHTLDRISREYGLGGYAHATQAYRRLITISGLNLTNEVLDGIEKHSGISNSPSAVTLEGQLIPFADKIAYLTSDIENAVSMGIIKDYPEFVKKSIGKDKSHMITTLVTAVIESSMDKDHISMDESVYRDFLKFREFNFNEIYYNEKLLEQERRCDVVITYLFGHLMKFPHKIKDMSDPGNLPLSIIDYIAGMTDRYAMSLFNDLSV